MDAGVTDEIDGLGEMTEADWVDELFEAYHELNDVIDWQDRIIRELGDARWRMCKAKKRWRAAVFRTWPETDLDDL